MMTSLPLILLHLRSLLIAAVASSSFVSKTTRAMTTTGRKKSWFDDSLTRERLLKESTSVAVFFLFRFFVCFFCARERDFTFHSIVVVVRQSSISLPKKTATNNQCRRRIIGFETIRLFGQMVVQ